MGAAKAPEVRRNWYHPSDKKNQYIRYLYRGGEEGTVRTSPKIPRFQWFRATRFCRVYQSRVPMSSLALSSNPTSEFEWQDFWRFVQFQQTVAAAAQLLIEYPPMQQAASFNRRNEEEEEEIEEMMKHHERR